jgi:hypothetical protein
MMPPSHQQFEKLSSQSDMTQYYGINQCSPRRPSSSSLQHKQDIQYCDPSCQRCESMRPLYEPPTQSCDEQYENSMQSQENCYEQPCEEMRRVQATDRCKRYLQPKRRQSFRPLYYYKPPEIPMSTDTVYRRSFEGIDSCTATNCRTPIIRPTPILRTPCDKLDDDTVTKVSFSS